MTKLLKYVIINERIETDVYNAFEFNIEYITGKRYSNCANAEKKIVELCKKYEIVKDK